MRRIEDLDVETRSHPWLQDWHWNWEARALTAIEDEAGWTIADRDTGELIGSFGTKSVHPTEEDALEEARRFGSKWSWPTIPGGLVEPAALFPSDAGEREETESTDVHDVCVTSDGRNLHDEGYCDWYGQDYNEWRG